jgi:hypothetical protein
MIVRSPHAWFSEYVRERTSHYHSRPGTYVHRSYFNRRAQTLMSLKTLPNDPLPWKVRPHSNLHIEDPKSHPFYHYHAFGPRLEIPLGASAKPHVWYPANKMNRPVDLSLTTDDIEGTKPRALHFATKRMTNPLDPEYHLPSNPVSNPEKIASLKGALPTNFTGDITGAHPRRLHVERSRSVDPETSSRRFSHPRANGKNTLDVNDINFPTPLRPLASRQTDPLDPVYVISAINSTALPTTTTINPAKSTVGPIEGSKPRRRIAEHDHSSNTSPIEGSSPQRYVGTLKHSSTQSLPSPIGRVPATGTRSGSLKRGLVSRRITNPLDPLYTLLDGTSTDSFALLGCH